MGTRVHDIGDLRLLWSIPIAFALHNLEEGLGVYGMSRNSTLPPIWRDAWGSPAHAPSLFYILLALITSAAFAAAAFGNIGNPRGRGARILVLLQTLMLINAFWHVCAAIVLRGYAPGVITAVALNLPLSWMVLRRSWSEHWIPRSLSIGAGLTMLALHATLAIVLLGPSVRG
ncbi:MAG: HXXEE domain-containing protein [Tahibacter sp.]